MSIIVRDAIQAITNEVNRLEGEIAAVSGELSTTKIANAELNIRLQEALAKIAYLKELISKYKPFMMFDATRKLFLGSGFEPLPMIYESAFYPTSTRGAPNLDYIKNTTLPKFRENHPTAARVVPDVEFFMSGGVTATEAGWVESIALTIRDFDPNLKFGFYSIPSRSLNHLTGGLDQVAPRTEVWAERNAVYQPVFDLQHEVFPSCYLLSAKTNLIRDYVRTNIEMARRLLPGKPVYPFIWPVYHNNAGPDYAGQPVTPEHWRLVLEACYDYANGCCLWLTAASPKPTIEPWWIETQKFMIEKGLT